MAGTEALVTLEPCGPAPRRAAHERAARRDPVGASRPGHATAVDPRPGGRPRDLRGLTVMAFEQLTAEGLLVSRRGAGTAVAGSGVGPPSARARPPSASESLRPAPIPPLHPGSPDPALFPRAAWRRAYQDALRDLPDGGLGYGDPTGLPELRSELAAYLGRVRAAAVDASSLIVTTGASQALALLATALRQAGETAIGVEDPGSEPIRTHLVTHDLRPVPIPVDGDGLVVDELAESGVRAVVVTPAHQFPLGHVLAPARRAAARGVGPRARRTGDRGRLRRRVPLRPRSGRHGAVPRSRRGRAGRHGEQGIGAGPAARMGRAAAGVGANGSPRSSSPPTVVDRHWSMRRSPGSLLRALTTATCGAPGGSTASAATPRWPRSPSTCPERASPASPRASILSSSCLASTTATSPERARRAGLGPLPLSASRVGPPGSPGLLIGYGAQSRDVVTAGDPRHWPGWSVESVDPACAVVRGALNRTPKTGTEDRLALVIDHDVLQRVLGTAMRSGGDFAEIYAEDKHSTSAGLDDGRVEQVTSGRDRGAGIRVIAGETTGFAHTADLSEAGLRSAAEAAAAAARGGNGGAERRRVEPVGAQGR